MDTGTLLLALAGLAMLGVGGDVLVRGAVGIAQWLRVSPMFTGLVLVGFGTSTPELVTSLSAALKGSPGIAVGNVLGSNIANTAPARCWRPAAWRASSSALTCWCSRASTSLARSGFRKP